MKSNRYQCPSSCADCRSAGTKDALDNIEPTYLQNVLCQSFFKCFCETTCGTAKRLNMRSLLVQRQLGRNLQDIDIPALLIFLSKHREITHLTLAGNDITDYGFVNLLDHILRHKSIEELDVENNNIIDHGIRYMMHAGNRLQLRGLNLKANKLRADACKHIAMFLLENKHLQSLNVAEVNQTASSLIYLMMVLSPDQEKSNTTLKRLNIGRPNPGRMYFFDSAHFADVIGHLLKLNATLTALHLQKYSFSCHDIENMMSNAASNNSLHLLDLGCNNIGDHGVHCIAEWLTRRPALKVLILSRNIITDHGARSLSRAAPFSKLLSLDVSYNKISDEGMASVMYTIKKSPMLRQLKIFGNCIGHPIAKAVKRMLLSGVLNQENIDVRPYRVDHRWYFARYEGERCRKDYDDLSYGLSLQPPKKAPPTRSIAKKYYKYTYSASTEFMFKHSIVTLISKTLNREHVKDCRCCYCFKCEAPHYDENCRKVDHPDTCACCKCKGDESSGWSVDESVLKRVVSPRDPIKNIEYILKRVDSDTKEKIVRWINMDEEILEEDLELIAGPTAKSESTTSCTCSWMQLNISDVQKYLQRSSSKDLLVIPEDYNGCCKDPASSDTVPLCSTHMK